MPKSEYGAVEILDTDDMAQYTPTTSSGSRRHGDTRRMNARHADDDDEDDDDGPSALKRAVAVARVMAGLFFSPWYTSSGSASRAFQRRANDAEMRRRAIDRAGRRNEARESVSVELGAVHNVLDVPAKAAARAARGVFVMPRVVGVKGATLSEYAQAHRGDEWATPMQTAASWYTREMHPDPHGTDPFIMSVFLIAFLARLMFDNWLHAAATALSLWVFDAAVYMMLHWAWPVYAREMNHAETMVFSAFYNALAAAAGLVVGSFLLGAPELGLDSVWTALRRVCLDDSLVPADMTLGTLYVPCATWQVYVLLAALFLAAVFATFDAAYALLTVAIVMLPAVAALVQLPGAFAWISTTPTLHVSTKDAREFVPFVRTFMVACYSAAYFLACMFTPLGNSYGYNVVFAASTYTLAASLYVGITRHFL